MSYRTCGGGGYGSPLERDPKRVLKDAREDKVRVERAREVDGVAIDADARSVDWKETENLRDK